jgi:CheY-like chemotaxis protein/two-component sensor histidine kinase/HPt (histidine-containing phosphotransfer) domain-containing protein
MSAVPSADSIGPLLERALSQSVRTPLHSLLGFLELLSMSELGGDQRRLHDQLVDSAEELLSGSERVLWLNRLMGGHYRPRPARVHLAAFIAEVAAATDSSVSTVVAPDAPPHIDTDLAALHQLVTELVTNATVHGGRPVVLGVSPVNGAGDHIKITVSDGGSGLPAAARQALVDSVNGTEQGQGFGFVLVRRLAALLGGSVETLPTHVGTHIAVTLPVATGGAAVVPEAGTASAPVGPTRSLRVLLVEDNATNRLLTERQLTRLGHSLTAVGTGRAGIDAAMAPDVDVVLMDRHLPDMDGFDAAVQIRAALSPGRLLPIIAVTADATAEARDASDAAGLTELLTKPVDLRHLGEALSRAASSIDGSTGSDTAPPAAEGRWLPPAVRSILAGNDDHEAAAALIETYLGELPGRRLRIQASLRRGEERAVVAAAESLRTSSESIGAAAVSGTCAALGAAAGSGDLPSARLFLPSLMAQCEHLAAELAPFAHSQAIS